LASGKPIRQQATCLKAHGLRESGGATQNRPQDAGSAQSERDELLIGKTRDLLIKIAVESWQFARLFERALTKLDAAERKKYEARAASFNKTIVDALAEAELKIALIEGQRFDPGMAAIPLNIEDFDEGDELVVDRMASPIIMGKDGLVRTGSVILRKVER
jgi:hypothetical protein